MQSRRDFIKKAAMLTGMAGASGVVPDSVQRAFAIEPAAGSTYLDAEHIVFLMQENRSFDHALGSLQGVRGFNDPRAVRLANGNSVFVQTNAAGDSYAPWRLDIKDTKVTWMGSIPHTRHSQVDAWNQGHQNGWLDAKKPHNRDYSDVPLTMGHYTRDDLPFYYALADAFTVCDQHYCGVMTSTTPNRSMFWTGTIRDEQSPASRVFMRNDQLAAGGLKWTTWAERMQDAGISWKFYQNELTHAGGMTPEEHAWLSNFGCNVLENFSCYNVGMASSNGLMMQEKLAALNKQLAEAQKHTGDETAMDKKSTRRNAKVDAIKQRIDDLQSRIAAGNGGSIGKLSPREQALHQAAFTTNVNDPHYRKLESISFDDNGQKSKINVPKGDVLHQLRHDVEHGALPTVSYIAPSEKFSDHPTSPWYGAWFVSEVVDILTKNPEVWKKTIFVLTYDENDGYFDHAPSFVAADPKNRATGRASSDIDTSLDYTYATDEVRQGVVSAQARSGPIGMGFRVPMIIASPWTRGGWVNSELCDHTSNIQFMEDFFEKKLGKKLTETNVTPWRRAVSGNLTSAFRPVDNDKPRLNFVDRDKFVATIQRAKNKDLPAGFKKLDANEIANLNSDPASGLMSQQEKGIRPSNALPYELYADGAISADRKNFELTLKAGTDVHGLKSQGSPFNVYLRNTRADSSAKKYATEKANLFVATYAVKEGDTLSQAFPMSLFADGKYAIDVHGPNGFFRSYTGDPATSHLAVRLAYEGAGKVLTGNARVMLRNTGKSPLTVTLADNAYKTGTQTATVAPGAEQAVIVSTGKSFGWYDFTVKAGGMHAEQRFAGRVETGKPSFSDPFMGRMV